MSSTKLFLWSKAPVIWSYGIAVLSVIAVAIISLWPSFHLQTAPTSLFLCAILFGAWLGGAGPGLLATALSATVFYSYFLPPVHSLAVKPEEIPRFVVFLVAALFVWSLSAAQRRATESVRRAREDLKGTVQDFQRINEELQTERRERKQAEDALRQAQADLAHVNRVTTMGELTASLAHEVN
jgi:K+-sensing histidine kinase KdpD